MIDRAERVGLGASAAAHLALLAALSLGLFAAKNKLPMETAPIDVQFVDEIGPSSAAPVASREAPAPSVAPEEGPPEEAAEQAPAPAPPEPTPALPQPAPAPTPAPKAAKPVPAPAAKPTPPKQRLGADFLKGLKTEKPGKAARGSRLGDDFLKGIAASREGKAATPPAAVSGAAMSSLAAAIKRQVQPCYNLGSLGGTPAMQIVTVLQLRFNRDGSVAGRPEMVEQQGVTAANRAYARQMEDVSRRAVLQCAPLKLPANLYEQYWKNIIMGFIPGQMQ